MLSETLTRPTCQPLTSSATFSRPTWAPLTSSAKLATPAACRPRMRPARLVAPASCQPRTWEAMLIRPACQPCSGPIAQLTPTAATCQPSTSLRARLPTQLPWVPARWRARLTSQATWAPRKASSWVLVNRPSDTVRPLAATSNWRSSFSPRLIPRRPAAVQPGLLRGQGAEVAGLHLGELLGGEVQFGQAPGGVAPLEIQGIGPRPQPQAYGAPGRLVQLGHQALPPLADVEAAGESFLQHAGRRRCRAPRS